MSKNYRHIVNSLTTNCQHIVHKLSTRACICWKTKLEYAITAVKPVTDILDQNRQMNPHTTHKKKGCEKRGQKASCSQEKKTRDVDRVKQTKWIVTFAFFFCALVGCRAEKKSETLNTRRNIKLNLPWPYMYLQRIHRNASFRFIIKFQKVGCVFFSLRRKLIEA